MGLGGVASTHETYYGLNWMGKVDAFEKIHERPIRTLIPCRRESLDFDRTQNLLLEGDNLEVLKLLEKSYFERLKMIYSTFWHQNQRKKSS